MFHLIRPPFCIKSLLHLPAQGLYLKTNQLKWGSMFLFHPPFQADLRNHLKMFTCLNMSQATNPDQIMDGAFPAGRKHPHPRSTQRDASPAIFSRLRGEAAGRHGYLASSQTLEWQAPSLWRGRSVAQLFLECSICRSKGHEIRKPG